MATSIKINTLEINLGSYATTIVSFPYSTEKQDVKVINLDISIKGTSPDNTLVNLKTFFNELYKIKDESKDCVLAIKPDTTNSTFYEILNYEIRTRDFSKLPINNQIWINIDLLVDNFGYSASIEIGNAGSPHATKTLPDYFDISASKGDVPSFTELFMKLLSANDIYNIYYGLKSEKLISDITDFLPILEAESQTLTNMTLTADTDCRDGNKAYSDATFPTADWATYIKFSLNNANYKGRYLVLVRCESESASDNIIQARLKYGNLYNDLYSFKATDVNLWRLIELGEIQVPYSETQAATSDYEIQLKGDAVGRIGIDYIALIPIDEVFGIRKSEINPIGQNNIYLVDTIKKIFSTYLQNINDNNSYDRGTFIFLPKGDTRVVIVTDSIVENKITDSMSFWLTYQSRYRFLRND